VSEHERGDRTIGNVELDARDSVGCLELEDAASLAAAPGRRSAVS
jgi:hypothetical protein